MVWDIGICLVFNISADNEGEGNEYNMSLRIIDILTICVPNRVSLHNVYVKLHITLIWPTLFDELCWTVESIHRMHFVFVLNSDGSDNNVYFLFNPHRFTIAEGASVLKRFCCYSFVIIRAASITFFFSHFDESLFYELDIIFKMIRNK